jgi:hypothetical protein
MSTPINCVGDKLIVGQIDFSIGNAASRLLPGTAVLNGPCFIGANASPGIPRATCMIGPSLFGNPNALEVIGITNIFGVLNVSALSIFTGITNVFGSTFKFALSSKAGIDLKNALNLGNGATVFNGLLTANGGITTPVIISEVCKSDVGIFKAVAAPFKQFNIPHPSKPGYRLAHGCLEGPEYGVYFRGKLKDNHFIELPKFWENLINPESITVHLTPSRIYQELYVKSIEWGKIIHIANNLGGPIECDYIIYAERKDIDKIVVEYEGDSI